MRLRQHGFVLIIVIGVLGVLASVAITLAHQASSAKDIANTGSWKSHARLLARSGVELAVSSFTGDDWASTTRIDSGWSTAGGDRLCRVQGRDIAAGINLNDGIAGGEAEFGSVYAPHHTDIEGDLTGSATIASGHADPYTFWSGLYWVDLYSPNEASIQPGQTLVIGGAEYEIQQRMDYWPGTACSVGVTEMLVPGWGTPYTVEAESREQTPGGLANLRLRRLLNSYGDAHRFVAQLGEPDQGLSNFGPGNEFSHTCSAVNPTGATNPIPGTSSNHVGKGLGDVVIAGRPAGGFKTVEQVRGLFNNWWDDNTPPGGSGYTAETSFFDMVSMDMSVTGVRHDSYWRMLGESLPEYRSIAPPDTSLSNFTAHPVDLVNLGASSVFVKAAVFYSLNDVKYLWEATSPIPQNGTYFCDPQSMPYDKWNYARYSRIRRSNTGVASPNFEAARITENGVDDPDYLQGSRFMSLRDALLLARHYQDYESLRPGYTMPRSRRQFQELLAWYRSTSVGGGYSYERAIPGTFDSDGDGETGYFTSDYVEKALPHLLSVERRVPSYLGAPSALITPYIHAKDGLYEVSDLVQRFDIPKVIYMPSGSYTIRARGVLKAGKKQLAEATIATQVALHDHKSWSSQADLDSMTDPLTDTDVLVGPEHTARTGGTVDPSPVFGFVGLHDKPDDLKPGETPQVKMDFTFADGTNTGLEPATGTNPPTEAYTDSFIIDYNGNNDVTRSIYTSNLRNDSELEDTTVGLFTNSTVTSDLSPFGGLLLSENFHGFMHGKFRDSIYWRLHNGPNVMVDPSQPTGTSARQGLGQVWFRMPSGHQYTKDYLGSRWFGHSVTPYADRYMNVIFFLRLWERTHNGWYRYVNIYCFHTRDNGNIADPTDDRNRLVARYEVGPFVGQANIDGYNAGMMTGYELAGYANDSSLPDQTDCLGILAPWDTSYTAYIEDRQRAFERTIVLKDIPETGPGTWHRVSLGWNVSRGGWGAGTWPYDNRIWFKLHDSSSVESESADFFEDAGPGTYGDAKTEAIARHAVSGSPSVHEPTTYRLWAHPMDGNMTLQLGEAQAQLASKLGGLINPYQYYYFLNSGETMNSRTYCPYWRLDSCVDNFRFTLGGVPGAYFGMSGAGFDASSEANEPMRYDIRPASHGDGLKEPSWVVRLPLENGTRILQVKPDLHIPADSGDGSPNGPNVPAVWTLAEDTALATVARAGLVEDDGTINIFTALHQDDNLRMRFTWKSVNVEDVELKNDGTDNWHEIPWIEGLAVHYRTGPPVFRNWIED